MSTEEAKKKVHEAFDIKIKAVEAAIATLVNSHQERRMKVKAVLEKEMKTALNEIFERDKVMTLSLRSTALQEIKDIKTQLDILSLPPQESEINNISEDQAKAVQSATKSMMNALDFLERNMELSHDIQQDQFITMRNMVERAVPLVTPDLHPSLFSLSHNDHESDEITIALELMCHAGNVNDLVYRLLRVHCHVDEEIGAVNSWEKSVDQLMEEMEEDRVITDERINLRINVPPRAIVSIEVTLLGSLIRNGSLTFSSRVKSFNREWENGRFVLVEPDINANNENPSVPETADAPHALDWEMNESSGNNDILDHTWFPPTQEPVMPVEPSIWEISALDAPRLERFDFCMRKLQLTATYPSMEVGSTTTRKTVCLRHPAYMAMVPQMGVCLVAETALDRIGVYGAEDFTFKGWFVVKQFHQPSFLLTLHDGTLIVREVGQISLFNHRMEFVNSFPGEFYGLTEGEDGEVYTIQYTPQSLQLRTLYVEDGSLRVTASLDLAQRPQANPRNPRPKLDDFHILKKGGVLYISDATSVQILSLDLELKTWCSFGYYGERRGQLKRPAGILMDETGNFLVADSLGTKLLIFNVRGFFAEEISLEESNVKKPIGLLQQGCSILVACAGDKKTQGAIVRLQLCDFYDKGQPMTQTESP